MLRERREPGSADIERWLRRGLAACADAGLVTVHDMAVSLAGFVFYNTSGRNPELAYEFAENDVLAAGEYAILTVSAAGTANYAYTGAQIFQMATGNFSNGGEAISLQDSYGNIIDQVVYASSGQWPSTTQPMTARAAWIATSLAGKELSMLELTLVGYAR